MSTDGKSGPPIIIPPPPPKPIGDDGGFKGSVPTQSTGARTPPQPAGQTEKK